MHSIYQNKPIREKPSCWQATLPSFVVHRLSQIVPQASSKQISIRPSISDVPLTNLKSPSLQTAST